MFKSFLTNKFPETRTHQNEQLSALKKNPKDFH